MFRRITKKITLTLALLSAYNVIHADTQQNSPMTALQEYRQIHANRTTGKTKFSKLTDAVHNFFCEDIGYQDVSEETEALVREVQKELGMLDRFIPVKKMSNFAIKSVGRTNAFVVWARFLEGMYISDEWFNTALTLGEKRFLIGHELAHLKQYHPLKRLLAVVAIANAAGLIISKLPTAWQRAQQAPVLIPQKGFPFSPTLGVVTLSGLLIQAFGAWHSRTTEKEADLIAAHTLKDARSGIEFIKTSHNPEDPESSYAIKRIYFYWFNKLFTTHPSCKERIAYLQEIADEQEKEAATQQELAQAAQAA